jgi:iron complex outermembrane receptor protein
MSKFNSNKQGTSPSQLLIRRSVHFAVLAALAAGSAVVQAQEAPTTSTDTSLQEVVVTGSLIKRSAKETAESITVISADSLKDQGITTVEQALEQISANQQAINTASTVSTFGTGGASLAGLRGLGYSHTLVLLDGQRLANNVVLGIGVDLNTIPFAAIERIEVLKEGASSLYGSDAIGGVINFITKKNYDKAEVDVNLNKAQHPGGSTGTADITFGHGNLINDGYNFLIAGNYQKIQELQAANRGFSADAFSPEKGFTQTNGIGTWPGNFIDANGNDWQYGFPGCAGNPATSTYANECDVKYTNLVDLIPQQTIWSAMAKGTKTLPWNNQISLQYFYGHSQSNTWTGPNEYVFGISQTSPYYPTSGAGFTCITTCSTAAPDLADPGAEVGLTDPNNQRYLGTVNTEQRVLLTFSGSNGGWDYETNLDWSENRNALSLTGGFDDYAVIAPGGTLADAINPFGPQSAAGQALIDSGYRNGVLGTGVLKYASIDAHASHELGDAFNAGRPASVAVGVTARNEKIDFNSTPLAAEMYSSSYYPPNSINGMQTDLAAFMELDVPITSQLDITIADRQDRYSDFGTTNNPKIQIRYQPFDILTFRGTASTGFRAPSLVDLFSPNTFGATAGAMYNPTLCTPGNYTVIFSPTNCNGQGMALYGGNTGLQPEKSQNFDLGVVISPIANLGITLDYYRIILKNEIQAIPDTAIYQNPDTFANDYVLATASSSTTAAGSLTKAPNATADCTPSYTAPTCGYILLTKQNTGGITTDGIDVDISYMYQTDFGRFRFTMDGTLVTQFLLQDYTGSPELNLVGQFNQGFQPAMRWQHYLSIDWDYQKFGAGISNTFQDRYMDYQANGAGVIPNVATYSLWNTYVSYKPLPGLTTVVGIRNILDKDPGYSNQTENWQAGYNPVFADPTGRTFYAKIKYEFAL